MRSKEQIFKILALKLKVSKSLIKNIWYETHHSVSRDSSLEIERQVKTVKEAVSKIEAEAAAKVEEILK